MVLQAAALFNTSLEVVDAAGKTITVSKTLLGALKEARKAYKAKKAEKKAAKAASAANRARASAQLDARFREYEAAQGTGYAPLRDDEDRRRRAERRESRDLRRAMDAASVDDRSSVSSRSTRPHGSRRGSDDSSNSGRHHHHHHHRSRSHRDGDREHRHRDRERGERRHRSRSGEREHRRSRTISESTASSSSLYSRPNSSFTSDASTLVPSLIRRHTSTLMSPMPAIPAEDPDSSSDDDTESTVTIHRNPSSFSLASSIGDSRLSALLTQVSELIESLECWHAGISSLISTLQKDPQTLAVIAITLAEIAALIVKMAPGAIAGAKVGFPIVFALLASPQFAIIAGAGVAGTIVVFGGYKIIQKVIGDKKKATTTTGEGGESVELGLMQRVRAIAG